MFDYRGARALQEERYLHRIPTSGTVDRGPDGEGRRTTSLHHWLRFFEWPRRVRSIPLHIQYEGEIPAE